MKLSDLVCLTRLGCESIGEEEELGARNEFKRDFDRIIFSSAFRRLQGKTQVFPFPENDHTHNRLTHSLEVFSIARSLGTLLSSNIKKDFNDPILNPETVGDFVGAAALAHDIGNSPFGHSGESAFSEYFKKKGKDLISSFSHKEKADFQNFEGNAVGFHILTKSKPFIKQNEGGLGLTYSTLASFIKYPTRAVLANKDSKNVSEQKHSFYSSDEETVRRIFSKFGIVQKEEGKWPRFPLAFLVEAADDIAYRIIDFEDGYRLGIIKSEDIIKYFTEIVNDHKAGDLNKISNISDEREKIGFLRAKAINSLIHQVCTVFEENFKDIMEYNYNESLLKKVKSKKTLDVVKNISIEELYNHKSVVEIEVAGNEIISGLLDVFLSYSMSESDTYFSKKIIRLISDEFYYKNREREPYSGYELVLNLSEYIFGMTDSCALNLYRKLKGIEIPRT